MHYNVIIIGGGPGGIFSAYELTKDRSDLRVAVFEAGHSLEKRHCPIDGDKVKSCIRCKSCSIMSGFGGAGAFSDGKYNITNDFGGTLHDVGAPVVLGALAALPHVLQVDAGSVRAGDGHRGRDGGEGAAQAREARCLGEGAAFHGHFLGTGDLEDAVRHIAFRIPDEGLVGRIIDDEGPVAAGIVHPGGQGIPVQHRAGGIVGVAEIDDVGHRSGEVPHEIVGFRAGQVDEVAPAIARPPARAARHGIGIHIDGIDRIRDRHTAGKGEQLLDVGHIALGSVTDEDLSLIHI